MLLSSQKLKTTSVDLCRVYSWYQFGKPGFMAHLPPNSKPIKGLACLPLQNQK